MTAKKQPGGGLEPSQVLAVVAEAGPDLNIDRLAEEMLDAFGGAKEFCQLLKQEYNSPGATSIAKANILQAALRVVLLAASKKSASQNLGNLSTAQLEATLGDLLTRATAQGARDAA